MSSTEESRAEKKPVERRGRILSIVLALQVTLIALVGLGDGLRHLLGVLDAERSWVDGLLGIAAAAFLGLAAAGLHTRETWGRNIVIPGLALGVLFQFGLIVAALQRSAWGLAFIDRGWVTVLAVLLLIHVVLARREMGDVL